MSALIIVGIVVGSIIGWCFCAMTCVRIADLSADSEYGIDPYDREMLTFLSFVWGPLALVASILWFLGRKAAGVTAFQNYMKPRDVQRKKKETARSGLRDESRRYRDLQRLAEREGRADEAELFRVVANDYESKARAS